MAKAEYSSRRAVLKGIPASILAASMLPVAAGAVVAPEQTVEDQIAHHISELTRLVRHDMPDGVRLNFWSAFTNSGQPAQLYRSGVAIDQAEGDQSFWAAKFDEPWAFYPVEPR